jgi:hypothetical protein
MDSDGFDVDAMDIDALLHLAGGDEAVIEGDERESIASSHAFPGYHESHDLEAQSVSCGSEAGWWDQSVDDEQNEWGLTDGDSMSTSEGELSVGDRFSGTYHVARFRTLCLSSALIPIEQRQTFRLSSTLRESMPSMKMARSQNVNI